MNQMSDVEGFKPATLTSVVSKHDLSCEATTYKVQELKSEPNNSQIISTESTSENTSISLPLGELIHSLETWTLVF